MYLNINKEELAKGLQEVLGPTTTKQGTLSPNNVLLKTTTKQIKLTTTDLDITIISLVGADVIEPGQVVVPMKRFFSIIRELPPKKIQIKLEKNNLLIKCEKIEFKVSTLNVDDFPHIKEENNVSVIKISLKDLEGMIKLTSFCVGYEDVSYVLNGILFELTQNKIKLIATDGKRLSFIQKNLPLNQPELTSKVSFILPVKAVGELYKLIKEKEGEVYLSVGKNKIWFDLKKTQLIARPMEGDFPDYSQYIPKEGKDKLVVDRKKLLFALRRASLFSTTDHQKVNMELTKNQLLLYKTTPQLGEVREELEVEYSGSKLELGFNPNYLIDVVKNLEDEKVIIDFFGADKPAVLRREGYVYLLLPMAG